MTFPVTDSNGLEDLRRALSRATGEEHARRLREAVAAVEENRSLALHVVCALDRVEEIRAHLAALCEAVGRENFSEALDHARSMRDGEVA